MSTVVAHERRARYRLSLAGTPPGALELIAISVLTAVAFGLRLSQLHQSLLGDEVFTYRDVVGHSFGSVLTTVHNGGENSPPLFFILAWASAKLGDPSVLIRLPSLLLGTATVPVVYAIGRESLGRVAGLVGAGVMALAPFAVWYGVEARPYAAMTFFVALSTLALLRAVSTRSAWWWAVYVVSAAAAAYTHYTCIFVLAVQALWSLWACRDRIRAPVISAGLIALLYVPWIPQVRGKALVVIGGLYPLGVQRVLTDLLRPIPGHPSAPLRAIPTIGGLVAFGVCVVAGLVAVGMRWRRAGRAARPSRQTTLLVALALATPIGLLLYSLIVTDLWLPRGLSASMPAAALVLGGLLAALPRPLTVAGVAAVTATLAAGTARSFDTAYGRGPYRQVAAYLDRVAGPRDPILYASIIGQPAISVQLQRRHTEIRIRDLARHTFPLTPTTRVYYVLDDALAARLGLRSVHFAGLQQIATRHYAAGFPTDVLTFRPTG